MWSRGWWFWVWQNNKHAHKRKKKENWLEIVVFDHLPPCRQLRPVLHDPFAWISSFPCAWQRPWSSKYLISQHPYPEFQRRPVCRDTRLESFFIPFGFRVRKFVWKTCFFFWMEKNQRYTLPSLFAKNGCRRSLNWIEKSDQSNTEKVGRNEWNVRDATWRSGQHLHTLWVDGILIERLLIVSIIMQDINVYRFGMQSNGLFSVALSL